MSEDQPVDATSFNAEMEQRHANQTPGATTEPQTPQERRQSIMDSLKTANEFGHHEDVAKLTEALTKDENAGQ